MEDGDELGMSDGAALGTSDGDELGMDDGAELGMDDGAELGMDDGAADTATVGALVGPPLKTLYSALPVPPVAAHAA